MNESKAYRPEIDGLRALAVLGVLVFHVNQDWLPGGFVGVDVFFVISGFLITRLILDEVKEQGRFSFKRFYLRRLRRLFPALFVTLLLTTVLSVRLLSPGQLERFAGELSHAVVSLSNFYFWGEAGYFDIASQSKPLLHTWSLSVEEQFYLLWPLMLVASAKVHRRFGPLACVIATTVSSLALNIWVLESPPKAFPFLGEDDEEIQAAVFFLVPFRMFELALGGLGYWIVERLPRRPLVSAPLTLGGLALILFSYATFDAAMDFPSLPALVPCLGALFVLLARPIAWVTWILGTPPWRLIGLASYSIYLIHWPILVFWQQWEYRPLELHESWAALVLSLGLGLAMYRFVEKPFRYRPASAPHKLPEFAVVCTILSLCLCFWGAHMWGNHGWPWRWKVPDGIETQLGGSTWKRLHSLSKSIPEKRKGVRLLLIGDSQMADFINIAEDELEDRDALLRTFTLRAECFPYFVDDQEVHGELQPETPYRDGWNLRRIQKSCPRQESNLKKILRREHFDGVIVGILWRPDHRPYIDGVVRNLETWADAEVALIGNKELRGSPLPLDSPLIAIHCVSRSLDCDSIKEINRFGAEYLGSDEALVSDYLQDFSREKGVPFFDFADALCSREECLVYLRSGEAVYKDKGHFNQKAFSGIFRHVRKPLDRFLDEVIDQG